MSKEAGNWHWGLILAILKWPGDTLYRNLENAQCRQFLRRILDFFKPTNALFAKVELQSRKAKDLAKIGCYFVDFLVKCSSVTRTKNIFPEKYIFCQYSSRREIPRVQNFRQSTNRHKMNL